MTNSGRTFRVWRCWQVLAAALLAVVILSGLPAARCLAQAAKGVTWEKVDAMYSDYRKVNPQKMIKTSVLLGQMSFASNQTAIDNWYRKYIFPAMSSQEHLGEIAGLREEVVKDLRNARAANIHQFLLDLAYTEATQRVTGNYHPAVKYNALLLVGQLNQTEARIVGSDRYPPVRLAKAFDFMVDQLKSGSQPEVVKLAAMLGIRRHLDLVRQRPQDQPIPDAKKAEVVSLMLQLVGETDPPANRSLAGHTWLRRRAVDVLATAGMVGDGQNVFEALATVAGDDAEPISLRCDAARALQRLDYTGVTGIDPLPVAQKLGALAAYACRLEDERVKEELKTTKPKASSGGLMGGFGGGFPGLDGGSGEDESGDEEGGYPGSDGGYPGMDGSGSSSKEETIDPEIQASRRRLKLPLWCVLLGLRGEPQRTTSFTLPGQPNNAPKQTGLIALAQDPQKAEINKIVAACDEILGATDTFDDGLEAMMKEVRVKTRDLESLLPAPPTSADDSSATAGTADNLPGAGPGTSAPGKAGPGKAGPGKAGPGKSAPGKKGGAPAPGKSAPGKSAPGKQGAGK